MCFRVSRAAGPGTTRRPGIRSAERREFDGGGRSAPSPVSRYVDVAEPVATSPAHVRRRLRAAFAQWELPAEAAENALMVVEELVANVVDHARTPFRLTVAPPPRPHRPVAAHRRARRLPAPAAPAAVRRPRRPRSRPADDRGPDQPLGLPPYGGGQDRVGGPAA